MTIPTTGWSRHTPTERAALRRGHRLVAYLARTPAGEIVVTQDALGLAAHVGLRQLTELEADQAWRAATDSVL